MLVEHIIMTPEKAATILEGNDLNFRNVNQEKVARLASSMVDNKWEDNGETVKINSDQKVLDGQHRLWAVVESGVSVPMLVVSGLTCEGSMIDRGTPRTIAQHLKRLHFKNTSRVAAVSRLVVSYKLGGWSQSTLRNISQMHDPLIIDFAIDNQDKLQDAINLVKQSKPYSQTTRAAIAFIASGPKLPSECETIRWFFDALRGAKECAATDPAFQLRNKWLSIRGGNEMPPFMQKVALTIGWNMTASDKPCTNRTFSFRVTGPNAVECPNEILEAPEAVQTATERVKERIGDMYFSMSNNPQ